MLRLLLVLGCAALLAVGLPLYAWLAAPGLVGIIERDPGEFYWVARDAAGRPLLMRAGRHGQPSAIWTSVGTADAEAVGPYSGDITALVDAVRARGRIEDMRLSAERLYHLRVIRDDMPGEESTYVYAVDGDQVRPVLALYHGFGIPLPEYGLLGFAGLSLAGSLIGAAVGGAAARGLGAKRG